MYFRVNYEVHSGYGGPFLSVPVRSGPFLLVNAPPVNGVAATTFYYSGIKDWNSLPSDVKQKCTFNGFKSAARQYLRSQLQLMESDTYVYMHLVFQFCNLGLCHLLS